MNDKLITLGVLGLTLVAGIVGGSFVYNFLALEDPATLLGQTAPPPNAPIYNHTAEEAQAGVTLYAGAHNFFSCNVTDPVAIDVPNANSSTRFWVYEFDGNEPPFRGDYYFSSAALAANPRLAPFNNLTHFRVQKRYYAVTDQDLLFRCNDGLSVKPYCGDGIITGAEECDAGDTNEHGCSQECVILTGYTCDGEPSSCTPLVPQLPSSRSSSSSSSSSTSNHRDESSASSASSTASSVDSESSASSDSDAYPWAIDATDNSIEKQYFSAAPLTWWGTRCDQVGVDHCIRYVSHSISGNSMTVRVRADIDPFDTSIQKYDFVSAVLWKRRDDGTWLKVTSIKKDQYWGNGPYPVYQRSLNLVPGTHVYKVSLHAGRVNEFGISVGQTTTLEERAWGVTIENPDPDVTIEGLQTELFEKATNYERVQFTGTVTGYSKGDHVGCINWGRGLERFRIADDGTFDVHVSKRVQSGIPGNPGNELFLRTYCPGFAVKLMILKDNYSIRTRCGLTNATIYDREDVCPFNQ